MKLWRECENISLFQFNFDTKCRRRFKPRQRWAIRNTMNAKCIIHSLEGIKVKFRFFRIICKLFWECVMPMLSMCLPYNVQNSNTLQGQAFWVLDLVSLHWPFHKMYLYEIGGEESWKQPEFYFTFSQSDKQNGF